MGIRWKKSDTHFLVGIIGNRNRIFAVVRRQPPKIRAGSYIGIKQQPWALILGQGADNSIRPGRVSQGGFSFVQHLSKTRRFTVGQLVDSFQRSGKVVVLPLFYGVAADAGHADEH